MQRNSTLFRLKDQWMIDRNLKERLRRRPGRKRKERSEPCEREDHTDVAILNNDLPTEKETQSSNSPAKESTQNMTVGDIDDSDVVFDGVDL